VTVRNTGTVTTRSWATRFIFTNGEQVTQAWSATVAQSGTSVSAASMSWNGQLAPGATTIWGFIGAGTSGAPSVSCTSA